MANVFETMGLACADFIYWGLGIPEKYLATAYTAADWWVTNAEDRSWRRIIYFLDNTGDTDVAEVLIPYCEPPSGE